MSSPSSRGCILLVGATGLVGRALHALLAPRYKVVTAGPDGCDRCLDLEDTDSIRGTTGSEPMKTPGFRILLRCSANVLRWPVASAI
jgi:hypothetical protein